MPLPEDGGTEVEALYRAVLDQAATGRSSWPRPKPPCNIQQLAAQAGDPLRFVYMLGSMLGLDVPREQALLEATTPAGSAAADARII